MMNLDNYELHTIPKLWAEYQSKLDKGVDEPYINVGDYVIINDEETINENLTDIANKCLPVCASCKVATDLYFTTVCYNGKDYILADSDIVIVLKPKMKG